jgi:hypothetical protein
MLFQKASNEIVKAALLFTTIIYVILIVQKYVLDVFKTCFKTVCFCIFVIHHNGPPTFQQILRMLQTISFFTS